MKCPFGLATATATCFLVTSCFPLCSDIQVAAAEEQTVAEELPVDANPTAEHQWLKKFVGHWESVSKGVMAEGQPPIESKGTITSKMFGEYFLVNEMAASLPGMEFKGIQTIGYDTKTKKYIGTWVDTTNGHMWKYEGSVDESGKKLVLEADGPDMTDPTKTTKYRDAYEFKTDDELIVTSSIKGTDGKWFTFMTGTSKRSEPKQQ